MECYNYSHIQYEMYYHGISIAFIILVIIIMVTVWKRKQKRRMLLTERIQLHDYDTKLPPEYMNNDMKGKLGDDPFLKVSQDPIYESFEQLPHNDNSYHVLRSFPGKTPLPLPMRSSAMPLDPFTVKDKEDTTSIQNEGSDGEYMTMNFYDTVGDFEEILYENGEDEGGNQ